MWITVFNPDGDVLYEGSSWPMARAALDHIMLQGNGCPAVTFTLIPEENNEP